MDEQLKKQLYQLQKGWIHHPQEQISQSSIHLIGLSPLDMPQDLMGSFQQMLPTC